MNTIINIDDRRFATVSCDGGDVTVKSLKYAPEKIWSITVVPEDSTLKYTTKDDNVIVRDLKKNDILVAFYSDSMGTPFVVVKSDEWIDAINHCAEIEQKQKEEWAAKQACNDCVSNGRENS